MRSVSWMFVPWGVRMLMNARSGSPSGKNSMPLPNLPYSMTMPTSRQTGQEQGHAGVVQAEPLEPPVAPHEPVLVLAGLSARCAGPVEEMTGLNTRATNREAIRPMVSVMGRYFMKSPMIPGQNIMGRSAPDVVSVEVITGQATSRGAQDRRLGSA